MVPRNPPPVYRPTAKPPSNSAPQGVSQGESSSHPESNSSRSPTILSSSPSPPEQAAQEIETSSAVAQAQGDIEIDPGQSPSRSDDGYDTDFLGSASTSLFSSVRDFTFENGRRYHRFREGAYNFPNDDTEQDRENMKHAAIVKLCQRLHFAPIGQYPQNILDMGTGTGIWAIESELMHLSSYRLLLLRTTQGEVQSDRGISDVMLTLGSG